MNYANSAGTISGNFVFTDSDVPEGATNLSNAASIHSARLYRNGILFPYQMDNTNDGGMMRVRGTSESNCILEIATWDDSGGGETIQFNYYPTTSQVTPTYSVEVPKKSGTIALTSDIPSTIAWSNVTGKPSTYAPSSHSHDYLPLSGGTLTGNLSFSNSGTGFRGINYGTMGDNDQWRIGGAATGSNAGYMEIATADDGTEPIYVRQYTGVFSSLTRTATLLDGSGNTSFPGTVSASSFSGSVSWSNVTGRPTDLSSFSNGPGYVTASNHSHDSITCSNYGFPFKVFWMSAASWNGEWHSTNLPVVLGRTYLMTVFWTGNGSINGGAGSFVVSCFADGNIWVARGAYNGGEDWPISYIKAESGVIKIKGKGWWTVTVYYAENT